MDRVLGFFSSFEAVIRYLATGALLTVIVALSQSNDEKIVCLITSHPTLAGLAVIVVGFAAFTTFRLVCWVLLDGVVWILNLSAPIRANCQFSYAVPYGVFLQKRHHKDVSDRLSGYLTYRWSVAYLAVIVGAALLGSAIHCATSDSFIGLHKCQSGWFSAALLAAGGWQILFLFRVEKALFR